MKHLRRILVLGLFGLIISCQEDQRELIAETKRISKQNDSVLKVLNQNWKFSTPSATPGVSEYIANWQEWKLYIKELTTKPTASLPGYRTRAKEMVTRAELLQNNIPQPFSKPEVRTRINVLLTKVRLLYTFLSADSNIPADRIVVLIDDINHESAQILVQFDEIVRRSQIKTEQGEQEMIRALDTVRMANPEMMQQPSPSRPQLQLKKQPGNP